jgi:hypothetical protein
VRAVVFAAEEIVRFMESEKLTVRAALDQACYLAARDKTANRAEFLKLARVYFDPLRDVEELGVSEALSRGPREPARLRTMGLEATN